jgi:hypothetical protein
MQNIVDEQLSLIHEIELQDVMNENWHCHHMNLFRKVWKNNFNHQLHHQPTIKQLICPSFYLKALMVDAVVLCLGNIFIPLILLRLCWDGVLNAPCHSTRNLINLLCFRYPFMMLLFGLDLTFNQLSIFVFPVLNTTANVYNTHFKDRYLELPMYQADNLPMP